MKIRHIAVSLAVAVTGLAALGATQAAALTPIEGRIFGLADDAGVRGDLFRTNNVNNWIRLTSGLSSPESVSASPDGRFAAICATRRSGGTYRIYRVSSAGGPLKSLSGKRQGCGQTVSPDSKRVAYVSDTGIGGARLNVVRANGNRSRTIYRFCSSCLYNPVWAGKRIYFERRVTRRPSADLEIYSVRAKDGKGLRRHTDDRGGPIDYGLADVSPNGRSLLAIVRYGGGTSSTVSTLSPNGMIRADLTTVSGTQTLADASFSPSGRSIAFLRRDSEAEPLLLWTGQVTGGGFFGGFPAPLGSTGGLYSIDWVRR
jgi:Tol biopolymer transport system component